MPTHVTILALFFWAGIQTSHAPAMTAAKNTKVAVNGSSKDSEWLSFASGMDALAQKYHIALIAEDAAFQPIIEAKNVTALIRKMDDAENEAEALSLFADAYDYEVIRFRSNTFLLEKRFWSSDDLCCVTPAEWNDALKSATRLLRQFASRNSFSLELSTENDLLRSFSPTQTDSLKPPRYLEYNELTQTQRSYFNGICLYFYAGFPLQRLGNIELGSATAIGDAVSCGWFDKPNGNGTTDHIFGYKNHVIRSLYPEILEVGPNGNVDVNSTLTVGKEYETAVQPIPMNVKLLKPDTTVSLEQVAKSLTTLNQTYAVVPMLAEKKVSLSGEHYDTASAIWNGIATIYGLRTRENSKHEVVLERKRPRIADNIGDLRQSVLSCLPLPFLHSVHLSADGDNLVTIRGSDFPGKPPVVGTRARDFHQWRSTAIKQLRTMVEPILARNKVESLPMSELPVSTKFLLANELMAEAEPLKSFVASPVPVYITAPESLVFTGHPYTKEDGSHWFAATVGKRRKNGTLEACWGVDNRTDLMLPKYRRPTNATVKVAHATFVLSIPGSEFAQISAERPQM